MSPASPPSAAPVVVIGAGIAGLVAALRLAAAGERVVLCEAGGRVGGKMAGETVGDRILDTGPTVLTMAGVFDDLPAVMPPMRAAERLVRHFWSGGATLDLHADLDAGADAVAAFAGAGDAAGYRSFSAAAARILDTLHDSFLLADRPATPLSLLWRGGLRHLAGFGRLDPYRPLSRMIAGHVADPRLRQLLGRYATYCGSSPYQAPATLALIAEVERRGVWLVEGGMRAVAGALADAAIAHGAELRLDCPVSKVVVERGRATGVSLRDGETMAASAVVCAADAAALADGRFGAAAARGVRRFAPADRSLSAFTVAFVADAGRLPLLHHNVAFADDAGAEFAALAAGRIADDPTVYLCAQDRGEAPDPARRGADGPGPPGERFLLVVNAPADGDFHIYSPSEIERCMTAITRRLALSGIPVPIDRTRCSISTPSDFERRFPATGGALYGRASHGWTASFRRPGSKAGVRGLYLAGGSVHPGAGVPMAALSGKAAARALLADRARAGGRGSIFRFRRAAMPGGTSTRSATADATA